MPKKPTPADAELILKIYDMRREEVLRRARKFMVVEFWPESADDLLRLANSFGTEENAYFRQFFSYWDMIAALVLAGTINEQLFSDTNGELWFMYAKYRKFIEAIREAGSPEFLMRVEKVALKTKYGRDRVARIEKMIETRRAMRKKAEAGR